MAGLGLPATASGGLTPGLGGPAEGARIGLPSGGLGLPTFGSGADAWGKVTGFLGSALESFPEFFGVEPSYQTQAFRAANPVSGFISQLAGPIGGFTAGARAIKAVPALAGIVEAAPEFLGVAERPILSTAARWATETGLIEAGRLGIEQTGAPGAVFGQDRIKPFGERVGEAGLDVAGGAALGGIVGGIGSRLATGPRVYDLVPEAHPSFPLVQRIRALDDAVQTGGVKDAEGNVAVPWTPEQSQELSYQLQQLRRANFADIEPGYTKTGHARLDTAEGAGYNFMNGAKLVQPLTGDVPVTSGRDYTGALNAWMKPNVDASKTGVSKLLTVEPGRGFATQADLDAALDKIGMTRDDLSLVGQNQRVLEAQAGQQTSDRVATQLENLFTNGRGKASEGGPFQRVANDWFIAREEDNGLWVAAKKIEGEVGRPKGGDQWFVMRTDTPDVLDPQAVQFRNTTINKSAYWPPAFKPMIGSDTYDLANFFEQQFGPMQNLPRQAKATLSAMRSVGSQISGDLLAYLSPAVGVVGHSPKGNYALNLMKTMTDFEEGRVQQILHGARELPTDRAVWRQFVTLDEPRGGGLADLFKTLKPEDWRDVQDMLEMQVPYEKMVELAGRGAISPRAYQVLDNLEQISRANVGEIEKLKAAVGAPNATALVEDFNARAGHYGLSRVRDGGFYALVDDAKTGELAGIVAGNTAGEARDAAVKLIAQQAKTTGRDLTLGGWADDMLRTEDGLQRFRSAIRRPGFLKQRGELLGDELMKGDLNAERFTKLVERNLRARERFKSNVVLQEKLWNTIQRLRNESPTVANQIEKRLNILQGNEGDFANFQNRAVDKVLGNVLGRDSASTIVRGLQKTMNAFQFGFGNLAHYILNAVTMFQTTFPEAAFLLRTAGRDTSNYITVPFVDGNKRIVDGVHVLSDVKLFGSVLKRVFSPAKELEPEWHDLVNEMTNQGLIAPHYAEAHFGATGTIVKNLKEAFHDGRSFVRWLGAVNEIALAKSEEFNRVVGTATAFELAKILGIAGDSFRLARFTREFLSKTAFNYATVDRPSIFTTPVGSLLGTFKTWQFHYLANMAKYAGGGRETLAPLLWQTAGTALLGGAAGTAGFMPIANAASKYFTNKSFMENVYQGSGMGDDRNAISDGLLYGLPGLLGLSLAAQAGSPGADPVRDAQMMFSFAALDRMSRFGEGAAQAIQAWRETGQSPWADDEVRNQLVRALAPRTLYRALSVSEDHAIKSLNNGYRVLDNVSLGSGLLYAMGFNPVGLDKTYAAYGAVKDDQARRKAATQELGRQLAEAWQDANDALATRVYTSAMAQGLDGSSVLRSAKARRERQDQTQLEFTLGKDKSGAYEGWRFALPQGEGDQ